VKGAGATASGLAGSLRTLSHEGVKNIERVMTGSAEDAFTSVTDPNWGMVDGQPTELRQALEQAKRENVLDQSYAYYLAGQAQRGLLIRASAVPGGRGLKTVVDLGMAPFRATELAVRRGTFITMYKVLQETHPEMTPEQRYEEAVRRVGLTQGDYTKGNRPRIMRGNLASVLFIFMTYVHNAAWGAYGGMEMGLKRQARLDGKASPGWYRSYTTQIMLLYLFAAGAEGLPFAENIMDLVDSVYKRMSGTGKGARQELRELVAEFSDPEFAQRFMRGATWDLGGLDISRSVGLGRIVPGTDVLASEHRSSRDFAGDMLAGISGVAGGYASWAVDTGLAMNKVWNGMPFVEVMAKQAGRLPGGIGQMMRANEWSNVDARGPAGGLLARDPVTGEARGVEDWEIRAKALGFQPSSISLAQTAKAELNDQKVYWQNRRSSLLENYFQAKHVMEDREALADVKQAIRQFNADAPDRNLQIGPAVLARSEKSRLRAQKLEEGMKPGQKMLGGVYEETRETFGLD
jgi:hypothetical protein